MSSLARAEGLEDAAVFDRERPPVRIRMMQALMHVSSQQLLLVLVAQHPQAGAINEGAAPLEVDSVDRFGSGSQEQVHLLFAPSQHVLGPLSLADVNCHTQKAWAVFNPDPHAREIAGYSRSVFRGQRAFSLGNALREDLPH